MMKKIILILILFSTAFTGKGQNLVPNGDFEQYNWCPNSISQLDSASFWFNPTSATPDYYNACATFPTVSVPNNLFGFQLAHSGVAYCGIILYVEGSSWREYIEVQLLSPLVANSCYHFEMYFNLGNNVKYTTDAIGVYFSDTIITYFTIFTDLPYLPQIENAPGNVSDTMNWIAVSGNYTAHGGENFIIIGNFKNNLNTILTIVDSNATGANFATSYTFIDDVSLTPCTAIEEQNQQGEIKIYPNPVKDYLKINFPLAGKEKAEIIITDILGKEIYRHQLQTLNFKLQTSNYKPGIYFIEINSGKDVYRKKFLKE